MKKIFLLLLSLLLLTSCESLTTKRKTVTFNNKSNKTNASVTSSTSNTTKPSSSSNTTKSGSTTSSKSSSDNGSTTTAPQKRKAKLVFSSSSQGETPQEETEFIIYEGENLMIGLSIDGALISDENAIEWLHSKTDSADISRYGAYLFILGLREGEITIIAETEDYEATGVVKILSKKNLLVDYFKTKGFADSTDDGDTEYYFCEMEVLNGVTYTYYFSYYKNEDKFEVYCNRKHTIDGASVETEGIISWSWGHYDQAEFVVTEKIKPNNNLEYSTTIKFDNSCITFNASSQNINIPVSYLYSVLERGWENITSEDCAEMWASVKSAHNYVLKFIDEKEIDVKLFHENYNY